MKNKIQGFASMEKTKRSEIASKGGKAAHKKGTAHEFNSEEAKKAGHKGGKATAKTHGSSFFSEIGRKGGISQSRKSEEPLDEGGE